jgi:DNA-binding PadR family transcriptional regulator
MASIRRVTEPTLDVLEVLVKAHRDGRDVHGWEIKKATGRAGPTIYGVIDRLEDAKLVEGYWEAQTPEGSGPRRRYYQLTGSGVTVANGLLAERRGNRSGVQVLRPRLADPRGGA